MITLVNFLILIEKISKFSKNTIDKGKTPLDIYKLCSIIREAFCCSYTIRKNNNLYFYVDSSKILIKFEGTSLRYLGSDERSQALLLKRALDRINGLEKNNGQKMQRSTPGIFIKRLQNSESILENIHNLYYDKIIVINGFKKENTNRNIIYLEDLDRLSDYCYVLPFPQNSQGTVDFLRIMDNKLNLVFTNLSHIKGIEDKILYVNYLIDQKKNLETEIK